MEIARHWRLKAQRYRLQGSTCPTCGQPSFPPRPLCPHCITQAAGSAGSAIPLWPASITTSGVESRMRSEITERLTE